MFRDIKDSMLFQADIQKYSDINLYLDEIHEAKYVNASGRLSERLVFLIQMWE